MTSEYYSIRDFQKIMREINYAPNGAGGAYSKRNQRKRRRDRRRTDGFRRPRQ